MQPVRIFAALTLLAFTATAPASAPGTPAELRASTVVSALPAAGTLDSSNTNALVFHAAGHADLQMPWERITQISVSDQPAVHLGVLPAIFVYLVVRPPKHHLVTISFRDAADALQIVTFQMSAEDRAESLTVLEGRASQACERRAEFGFCQPIASPIRQPAALLHP